MLKIKKNLNSVYLRKLPLGCKLCKEGKKLVIFVTGICPRSCFYCPLSDSKKDKDLVWANEWKIDSFEDIITEAKLTDAKGAGITGGDPLSKLDRTIKIIKLLKKNFDNFHIHLYTSLDLIDKNKLDKLYNSGLDEIRVHPDLYDYKLWEKIKLLKNGRKWDVGIEIPAIPDRYFEISDLISTYSSHIDFVNLNELEISDNNSNSILKKEYRILKNSYGIKGSSKIALKLISDFSKKNIKIPMHYCSTKLKDSEQMKNRIIRRAKNVSYDFDYITRDGMLFRGAIYPIIVPSFDFKKKLFLISTTKNKIKLEKVKNKIISENYLSSEDVKIDFDKMRILVSPDLIENIKTEYKKAIVTEYPTKDGFEVDLEFV